MPVDGVESGFQYTLEDPQPPDESRAVHLDGKDVGHLVGQSVRITDYQTAELVAAWLMLDDQAKAKVLATTQRLTRNK